MRPRKSKKIKEIRQVEMEKGSSLVVVSHADDEESLIQTTICVVQDEVAQVINIKILATSGIL